MPSFLEVFDEHCEDLKSSFVDGLKEGGKIDYAESSTLKPIAMGYDVIRYYDDEDYSFDMLKDIFKRSGFEIAANAVSSYGDACLCAGYEIERYEDEIKKILIVKTVVRINN